MEFNSKAGRWLVGFTAPLLAALIVQMISPWVGPGSTPPYMLAVMIAAAFGGLGPGLLATLLATGCIAWFEYGSTGSIGLTFREGADVAMFALAAILISSLAAARNAAQRNLKAALAELSATDRAKDEFIATISHELRTPLTSMTGWLQILRGNDVDEDTRELALRSMEQSVRTQRLLVDDLLDVSRIILGKLQIKREVMVLNEPVSEAIHVIEPVAAEKNVRLQHHVVRQPLLVRGDPQRLKQVVWNLLSNAVKFTPEGGTVELRLERQNGSGVIVVQDTGLGIDREVLPHLFERFRQGNGGLRKGGLGLGLSISRHIVDEHGGQIAIHSEGRGRGTTVVAEVPLAGDRAGG